MDVSGQKAVLVSNARGRSPFVIVCDHASNRIPAKYGDLGLTPSQRLTHIAWDPGALAVSHALSDLLDAPLVQSTVSRLIIDCNRELDAPDLIWTLSESTHIAANENLDPAERQYRIDHFHRPYHASIETLLEARRHAGRETILVCMHSFTPVYNGVARPWPIGLIHGVDTGYTKALFDALKAEDPSLNVGWNEPYAALNGVTLTLEKHGDGRGLDATMIEIRNDEILEPAGVALWSTRLARCLEAARQARKGAMAV
ncbi:MAG: N-formylglutamate amidohydrolase [Alphaproteobacteria bacterium]|nr:N-formylglutamate amidohydrolase [Alphaproteobacteria bacterium]MBU1562961.1 N-formylglutamate amidohydrolase [Alphaproteobacteria bacterium]MBU2304156.1 N-formylglutamate amidohydrolase [Alphaproteobacteria bacterium]MBU2367473.1 N-formylglutamate amidohydrolase [Alphaproteobacteria bacterium]